MKLSVLTFSMMLAFGTAFHAEATDKVAAESGNAAYVRTLHGRATKIVAALGISDSAGSNRVQQIIVQQYLDLSAIHGLRDEAIKIAKSKAGDDKASVNAAVESARAEAKPKLDKLHGEFLAKLSSELSPAQVDKVKDGLTYHVLHGTYGVYLKMYPALTDEEKKQVMDWLVEAREIAMDGSTSDEKHAVFGKYKGRINNYLSKRGYDAKKGQENLKKPNLPTSETKTNQP